MIASNLSLAAAAEALDVGVLTSRELLDAALEAIDHDPTPYVQVDIEGARAAADAADARRRSGRPLSSVDGAPISLKDLFDVSGQRTLAGSRRRADAEIAAADAPAVAHLRAAGLVFVGRTQMSEFAFTGLGLNPHVPRLENPRAPGRVPGGSSGGAAASVALGQALAALGTDTGGSVRIPAAFCGLVGFKPTQGRISRRGVFPLSPSLDSVGPIARTVEDCRLLDAILAGEPPPRPPARGAAGAALGVPDGFVLEEAEAEVAAAFEAALGRLEAAGVRLIRFPFPELEAVAKASSKGSISNAEAFAFHRRCGSLERAEDIDPNVRVRILAGEAMSAADYLDLLEARIRLKAAADRATQTMDAVILPTSPIAAPRFDDVANASEFQRLNALVLRNPSLVNFLDRCAISLPMAASAPSPIGLMLMGAEGEDAALLELAAALAPLIA